MLAVNMYSSIKNMGMDEVTNIILFFAGREKKSSL